LSPPLHNHIALLPHPLPDLVGPLAADEEFTDLVGPLAADEEVSTGVSVAEGEQTPTAV
jgi:hypothetical protein